MSLWIRMLDCNQASKQNRSSMCVAMDRQQNTAQLIKNEGKKQKKKELNINL